MLFTTNANITTLPAFHPMAGPSRADIKAGAVKVRKRPSPAECCSTVELIDELQRRGGGGENAGVIAIQDGAGTNHIRVFGNLAIVTLLFLGAQVAVSRLVGRSVKEL
ncbi:hypothetical protein [Thalassoglobus polymorphus]|uniref:Uncharacterized protein n=1 Tax=Thalassoglobus polymorphus TaxID=2527994 RepID=A0A517QGZ4_9PLAN|nr:hypothetical protein [Thalassoglobus polymorphus]QDT30904.1 hypothetical protein Mal48_01330 [Thalassoglobus polymorphus]QDT30949.1 hypothetical protein Mal48_01780 [Thalassoglobus polymorphus]